jgi:hypothetical protein
MEPDPRAIGEQESLTEQISRRRGDPLTERNSERRGDQDRVNMEIGCTISAGTRAPE